MEKIAKRQSNIELLRIAAMLMVISLHYFGDGGFLNEKFHASFNSLFAFAVESVAIIGVNLFMLITGYFGINQTKGIRIRKIVNIIVLVEFWTVLFYLFQVALNIKNFDVISLLKCLWPFHFKEPGAAWRIWYIDVFIQISLLAPFINLILNKLDRKQFTVFIVIVVILCSVAIPLTIYNPGFDLQQYIMMYSIGGYIRRFGSKKVNPFLLLAICILCSISCMALQMFGNMGIYWNYNFILIIISAVAVFKLFSQFDFESKTVNFISKSVVSIYIINIFSDFTLLRDWFYHTVIKTQDFYYSNMLAVHFALFTIAFFAIALVLDLIRRLIFKYSVDKVLDNIPVVNKCFKV